MQKDINELNDDLRFFAGTTAERYLAYPSAHVPRFIVPERDEAARRFIARILAADLKTKGVWGRVMALLAPLVLDTFANRMLLSGGSKELFRFVEEGWSHLGREEAFDKAKLRFTKFCQRIAGPETKVLFLATYGGVPLLVLKTMRDAAFDGKLRDEKNAQERAGEMAARVLFEGTLGGHYAYAEEVIDGAPLSRAVAHLREEEVVRLVAAFPREGTVSSRVLGRFLRPLLPKSPHMPPLLDALCADDIPLRTGLSHGDLGAPNILVVRGALRIIDWEHAGERPFYLLDAVYFMMRLRRIHDLADWHARAQDAFMRMTSASAKEASALYALLMIFEVVKRKYATAYPALLSGVRAAL